MAIVQRFLSKVIIKDFWSCWTWRACVSRCGYGAFQWNGTKKAHRVSWILFRGPIPKDLIVCHRCDNPLCVNPVHLFLGTQKDNMKDASKKGRMSKPRTPYISVPKSNDTHPRSKLTNKQVRFIRSSVDATKILAEKFNVHPRTIRDAKNRRSYTDVL